MPTDDAYRVMVRKFCAPAVWPAAVSYTHLTLPTILLV